VEFHPEVGVRRSEVAQGCRASGKVDSGERPRSEARGMRMLVEGSKKEAAQIDDGRSYKLNAPHSGIQLQSDAINLKETSYHGRAP